MKEHVLFRDCIFAFILCAVLCLPGALYVATHNLEIEVPEWLTMTEARYLQGYWGNVNVEEHASIEGFVSGKFQKALEDFLAENIPAKGIALLENAALQRSAIEVSNWLFDWPCYPTFFGSSKLYLPEQNALARMPSKGVNHLTNAVFSFGEQLTLFAERYPEITFNVVLGDISEFSSLNPASSLSSNTFSTLQGRDILVDTCSSVENIKVGFLQLENVSDYYLNYYTTDHHWNGFGAARTYAVLKDKSFDLDSVVEGFSNVRMNGSMSREGLMLLDEPAREPLLHFGPIVVEGIGEPNILLPNGAVTLASNSKVAEFDFYHGWYGPSAQFNAQGSAEKGRALVICDSFGSAFQWLVIDNHSETNVRYDMHVSFSGEQRLCDILDSSHYDEVYFVAHIGDYAYLLNRFPKYFD